MCVARWSLVISWRSQVYFCLCQGRNFLPPGHCCAANTHWLLLPPPPPPHMDPPSQGPPYSNVRQQLFHSLHLPCPSQPHLPPVSSSCSNINTLPSLNPSSPMSPYTTHRHPSLPLPALPPPGHPPSAAHRLRTTTSSIHPVQITNNTHIIKLQTTQTRAAKRTTTTPALLPPPLQKDR